MKKNIKSKNNHSIARTIFAQVIVFSIFSFIFLSPLVAHAQNFARFNIPAYCNEPGRECGWNELIALGSEILQFAVYLAVLGATVAFVVAGGKMVMNQGNEGEISKAKGIMGKAALGLVITMSAWLIVDFILDNLGVGNEFRTFIQ